MAHDYGVRLALVAFATATIQGLLARSAFEPSLKLALGAAAGFYCLGWLCGEMARRIVEESVQAPASVQPPSSQASSSPAPRR